MFDDDRYMKMIKLRFEMIESSLDFLKNKVNGIDERLRMIENNLGEMMDESISQDRAREDD
jgi:hypothetical protein